MYKRKSTVGYESIVNVNEIVTLISDNYLSFFCIYGSHFAISLLPVFVETEHVD